MIRRFYPMIAILTLALAALACGLPGLGQPTSAPNEVETIVAATLQALTPASGTGSTSTPEPEAPALLPHSFYFLSTDSAKLMQVFRIEKDGKTRTQVTSEPVKVDYYDVSPVDGSVAYVINNQLFWVAADGSGRKLLVDGGVLDQNNPFLSNISSPVFSPDGRTIAYGYKGLNFYALDSGVSNRVLENQIDDFGNGMLIPKELYWPEKYSPDGTKLLITLGYYEGASAAVYYPGGNALVRLKGGEGALICCDQTQWAADGSSFYSGNPAAGMFAAGLWKVDAATGEVTTLLDSNWETSTFNFADQPYLAPDGQLYYFFMNSSTELNTRAPLQLVRSAPDGVTGRTVLRPETFELMNEAIWAPDGSFVVVAYAPIADVYFGGQAQIVYVDGSPSVVLSDYAQTIKWGP